MSSVAKSSAFRIDVSDEIGPDESALVLLRDAQDDRTGQRRHARSVDTNASWTYVCVDVRSATSRYRDVKMIAVVEIEVRCEKLFEQSLIAHRASETVDWWILRATANTSREIFFDGERLCAEFKIMQIDRETVGVVTQPAAACAPIGVGPREPRASEAMLSENGPKFFER